jgi:hypothetical protein
VHAARQRRRRRRANLATSPTSPAAIPTEAQEGPFPAGGAEAIAQPLLLPFFSEGAGLASQVVEKPSLGVGSHASAFTTEPWLAAAVRCEALG